MSTTYVGRPESADWPHVGAVFVVDGAKQCQLPLRLDLLNVSPTGFAWGYNGSGPAQLALAILAHATGSDDIALRRYHEYKWAVVSRLPRDSWQLDAVAVREWVEQREVQA